MKEDEILAKSQYELEKIHDRKELNERNKKSSKRLKKSTKEAKSYTKNLTNDQESNSLSYLLRRLIGLKSEELNYRLDKEENKYRSNKRRSTKTKSLFDKYKKSRHKGISNYIKNNPIKRMLERDKAKRKKLGNGGVMGMLFALIPVLVGLGKIAVDKIKGLWEKLKDSVVQAWDGVKNFVLDSWDSIKEGTKSTWNSIKDGVSDWWDKTTNRFNLIIKTINEWTKDLANGVNNIFSGIHNFFADLWNKIAESGLGELLGLRPIEKIKTESIGGQNNQSDQNGTPTSESEPVNAEGATTAADKMTQTAIENSSKKSNGGKYDESKDPYESEQLCARHTVDAINSGLPEGVHLDMPYKAADLYDGNELEKVGFAPVDLAEAANNPTKGTVIVEDAAPGKSYVDNKGDKRTNDYGHIQLATGNTGYNDRKWVSDFLQKSTNVHDWRIAGNKKAFKYVGLPSRTGSTNQENPGLGGNKSSVNDNSLVANSGRVINNINSNNSRTIITGSNGAEDQRY